MDKQNINLVSKLMDKMDYFEKKEIFEKYYSLGALNGITNVNDKLILISLVSLTYLKMKEKDSQITPIAILMKIMNQSKDGSAFYQMLEGLGIIVEDLSYSCNTADACGLKTSQEIINKIKDILNTWLPF